MIEIFIAPIVMLVIYIYIKDRYEKEPIKMVILAITLGAFLVFLSDIIEGAQSGKAYLDEIININDKMSIILLSLNKAKIAGITEEILKFIVMLIIIYPSREFNEPFDGILYGIYLSLGFAMLENILYFMNAQDRGLLEINVLGIKRTIFSTNMHLIYGFIMGYHLSKLKFRKIYYENSYNKLNFFNNDGTIHDKKKLKKQKYKIYLRNTNNFVYSLMIPMFLHTAYDFIVLIRARYILLLLVELIFDIRCISAMNFALAKSPFKKKKKEKNNINT